MWQTVVSVCSQWASTFPDLDRVLSSGGIRVLNQALQHCLASGLLRSSLDHDVIEPREATSTTFAKRLLVHT